MRTRGYDLSQNDHWGVLLASLDVARPVAQTCDSAPLRIRNANVWTRDGIVANRDVLFRAVRLAVIGPTSSQQNDGVRTIDGTGHTLLPGLIDSHLHLSIPGGLPASDTPRSDAEQIAGRQLLRSGVTSGRLHLATIEEAARLKTRSASPCEPMPRLQAGGPGLSGAVDKDFGNFQGAKSRDAALAKIAGFRDAGVDWVAIHNAEKFPSGVLETLAAAARKAGIRLMASGERRRRSLPHSTSALTRWITSTARPSRCMRRRFSTRSVYTVTSCSCRHLGCCIGQANIAGTLPGWSAQRTSSFSMHPIGRSCWKARRGPWPVPMPRERSVCCPFCRGNSSNFAGSAFRWRSDPTPARRCTFRRARSGGSSRHGARSVRRIARR